MARDFREHQKFRDRRHGDLPARHSHVHDHGSENFSFEAKARADESDPKVREWEQLMWKFQQALPEAKPGEKWLLMERVFKIP
jgi:hypothetical protein